jgi:hypothetical protein
LADRAGPVEVTPIGPAGRRIFVWVAVAGVVISPMISVALRAMGGVPAFVIRGACLVFVALVIAALAARARDSSTIHNTIGTPTNRRGADQAALPRARRRPNRPRTMLL